MLGRVLRQAWWDFYDCLWRLVAANMVLGTVAIVLLFVTHDVAEAALSSGPTALALCAVYCLGIWPVFGAVWFGALGWFAVRNARYSEGTFGDMVAGVRAHFAGLWKCLFASGALVLLLGTNLWFYLASGVVPERFALGGYVLAFLTCWLVVGVAGATLHGVMLVVARGMGPVRALRLGMALTMALPGPTLGVLGVNALVWAASSSCQFAGFLLAAFAATAVLANALHDAVGAWEESLHGVDSPERAELRESYDRRYDRGWRDMLRPWEF